jgi:hypothetical protein
MQVRSCDGIAGPAQSQVVQKLQSICAHESPVASCDRQPATQVGFSEPDEQIPLRKLVNGWPAQRFWTRATWASQLCVPALS